MTTLITKKSTVPGKVPLSTDLQVGELTYAKSFYPSQLVAQIAGHHYQQGDECVFLLEPCKFDIYDKVYFIYDYPELYFNRDWQFLNNAYFGGVYSPIGDTLPSEIKNSIPSFKIYVDSTLNPNTCDKIKMKK